MIDENSIYVACEKTSKELKNKIEKEVSEKFSDIKPDLSDIDWNKDGYFIYSLLNRKFTFPIAFEYLGFDNFSNYNEKVKYFGIDDVNTQKSSDNVEILFYNNTEDFAVKIKTNENDRLILYKTNENSDFENYWTDVELKRKKYDGNRKLNKIDILKIPYILVNTSIEYKELHNKIIKNTNQKISSAIQNVEFTLNEQGGGVQSEASIVTITQGLTLDTPRKFIFNDSFIVFIQQEGADLPYFAYKITDIDPLVKEK